MSKKKGRKLNVTWFQIWKSEKKNPRSFNTLISNSTLREGKILQDLLS